MEPTTNETPGEVVVEPATATQPIPPEPLPTDVVPPTEPVAPTEAAE